MIIRSPSEAVTSLATRSPGEPEYYGSQDQNRQVNRFSKHSFLHSLGGGAKSIKQLLRKIYLDLTKGNIDIGE
jgi:hypothetical protein